MTLFDLVVLNSILYISGLGEKIRNCYTIFRLFKDKTLNKYNSGILFQNINNITRYRIKDMVVFFYIYIKICILYGIYLYTI